MSTASRVTDKKFPEIKHGQSRLFILAGAILMHGEHIWKKYNDKSNQE